jgi:intracellular sulfur oxidation DsrE/DsrF family protein
MSVARLFSLVPAVMLAMCSFSIVRAASPAVPRSASAGAGVVHEHHVVFQVDSDDPGVMGHAISGAINATRFYAEKHESISIEIVANGKGLKMFIADSSPIKEGVAVLRTAVPNVVLSACGSSKQILEAKEGHQVTLIDGVRVVSYGIGRVIELEEAGWAYIHA